MEKEQEGWPKETGDMHLWGHHLGCETVDDPILRDAGRKANETDGYVSFVFSLQVRAPPDPTLTRRAPIALASCCPACPVPCGPLSRRSDAETSGEMVVKMVAVLTVLASRPYPGLWRS